MSRSRPSVKIEIQQDQSSGKSWMWLGVVWLALVFLVSLQLAPPVIEQRRDSGIFAYTGKVIAEGGLPYIDAWDNKLPGIYYIDALAFVLFGTNRWALWIVENITLVLTGLVMFGLLRQVYRQRAEVWIGPLLLVLFARHPGLVSDVNFTEPYALLPQVIVFAAGYRFLRDPGYRWAFVIGFAAGVAFLIKQTTVGVALAFIPAILISRDPAGGTRRNWHWLGVIALGGLSCLGIVAGYLLANGILDDALVASFVAASDFHQWVGRESAWIGETVLTTLTASTFPLVYGPFVPFLAVGIGVAVRRARALPHPDREAASQATFGVWVVLTLLVDLVLANITNRGYAHYYVTLAPAATLLIIFSLPVLARLRDQSGLRWRRLATGLRVYLVALLIGVPLVTTLVRFWLAGWNVTGPERRQTVAEYVIAHSAPEDKVLVWGADTVINFQSGRDSPTQYHYGYPLIVPDETTEENIRELVNDLAHSQPALIVDTTLQDGDRIPPLDPIRRARWWLGGGRLDVENLAPVYDFVADHCHIIGEIGWVVVYHCRYPLHEDLPLAPVLEPPGRALSAVWERIEQNQAGVGEALLRGLEQLQ